MLCSSCFCSLQNDHFSIRQRRSAGLFSLMLLAALAVLCSSPLNTAAMPLATDVKVIEKRSGVAQSRDLCDYFSSASQPPSCSYHDSCVEGIFECNSKGFHVGYSKPRCEAVQQLRKSSKSCSSCLNHQEFVDWSLATEECFQPKLKELAKKWSDKVSPLSKPDPQMCIGYEMEALNELKECYQEHVSPVCDVLSDKVKDEFVEDLKKVASVLSVSDYYKPLVHNHLKELISSCPAQSATETAEKAIPKPPKKVIFCVASNSDFDDFVPKVANILSRSSDQFVYADIDELSDARDVQCQFSSPPSGNGGLLTDYRLIEWSPKESDTLPNELEKDYSQSISATTQIFFYELSMVESSCGNGLREVGEMCDTFGEIHVENSEYGCNKECQPFENFECSVSQLALSSCNKEECGDGMRSSGEQCDDGNLLSGDGCDTHCEIESMFECTDLTYNSTSSCKRVEQVSSTVLPAFITPTTVVEQHSTSSVSVSTTTMLESSVMATPVVTQEPISESVSRSSAHSSIRTSSLSWLTIVLILTLCSILLR